MHVENCKLCDLHIKRKNIVNGDGNPKASLFILGESPGYYEDKIGKPFIGASGKLLKSELKKHNIDNTMYFITNVIRCKPKSQITKYQLYNCKQYWLKELKYSNAKIILLLGRHSINSVFPNKKDKMVNLSNTVVKQNNTYFVLSYHPAYILRNDMQSHFKSVIDKVANLYKKTINEFIEL